jgi:FkbH-like protein
MTLAFSNEFSIPRIAQLTQKTNQFNMTTKRYSLEEIKRFHDSTDNLVVSCQITDIYGDSGITGVCIVEQKAETAWIDTFLLSCRILGRRAEYAFLSEIVSLLRDKGIKTIYAKYLKTEKNREHAGFYQNAGFSVLSETESETEFCLGESGRLVQAEEIEVIVKGETKYG